jgi:hypothetical protein
MKGAVMRTVFAGYSAANAHYTSPTEGFDKDRVSNAMLDGGLFIERAAWRLYQGAANDGYKDPETGKTNWHAVITDASMMLSMGGIPGGGGGRDATAADVGNRATQVASEWRHPVETAKAEIGKVVKTAKQFREQLKKLMDGVGAKETSTVYRTQGGKIPNASRHRILIDENGNITIIGDKMLYVTLDDIGHQVYFYNKRGGATKEVEIVSFKIPKSLAEEIKQSAVPQDLGKGNTGKPQISDETKSANAYGLPKEYIEKIQEQAIKGSGKIISISE